jgi:hypothetical protein
MEGFVFANAVCVPSAFLLVCIFQDFGISTFRNHPLIFMINDSNAQSFPVEIIRHLAGFFRQGSIGERNVFQGLIDWVDIPGLKLCIPDSQ